MPGKSVIKFGTSGWRAIIGEDFTFANVRLATRAIAAYIKKQVASLHHEASAKGCCPLPVTGKKSVLQATSNQQPATVVVGYDTRFMGEDFALECARVLAENGIQPLLTKEDTPTPVIAYEIIRRKAAGGINFTASHNPYRYSGIKFSPSYGGPAFPEITDEIERNITKISTKARKYHESAKGSGLETKFIEPKDAYIKRIKELVDLRALKKLKIVYDPLYGTGRNYVKELLQISNCKFQILHNYRDAMFGGNRPEPDSETLKELSKEVRSSGANLGISTDGDADRFGIIDSDGAFISPNEVVSLLVYYLNKTRGWKDPVVRSVATTHMIDALAKKRGMEVIETPVGFKFIAEAMQKRDITIGGEESGGLTVRRHIPEKDGILACLLTAEMIATEKKPLKQIMSSLYRETGLFVSGRINLKLNPEMDKNLRSNLSKPIKDVAGLKVTGKNLMDGTKLLFGDGSWMLFRFSGTEPVARVYAEANSARKLGVLLAAGKKLATKNN